MSKKKIVHSSVTYGDLLERLKKMTKRQLEMSVTVGDPNYSDEVCGVQRIFMSDADGVLDGKHLILETNDGDTKKGGRFHT